MPKMLDIDMKNERILKEFIEGYTIYELALEDKVRPSYIKQIKNMCEILYPLNINIDYFPTNFIVSNELLWYIDYECNDYMEEWNFENWGIKYWSKTPELIEYYNKNKTKEAIYTLSLLSNRICLSGLISDPSCNQNILPPHTGLYRPLPRFPYAGSSVRPKGLSADCTQNQP